MAKKQKAESRDRNTSRDRERPQGKRKLMRIIIIALSSVIVLAAIASIAVYLTNRGKAADVSSFFTISGTVSYAGAEQPGRVYIQVSDGGGSDVGLGTSIGSPGRYAIRNVPAGTYGVTAWMDNSDPQTSVPSALSPRGSITVGVNNGNVSGQNIDLLDPSRTPAPTPPVSVGVAPGNGSVLVQWNPPLDSAGNILAQSYNVYFSTSNSVSPLTGEKREVRASNNVFISGLTDGNTYYFAVTAVLGGVESPASTPPVSAIVGANTGSNTISGAISFPVRATGAMYVGVSSHNSTLFQRIEKPVSPQSYRISGVPSGAYVTFAIIDMNNNGVVDTGDLNKTTNNPNGSNPIISVAADMDEVNQTLLGGNVLARVTTIHVGSESSSGSDVFAMQFEVGGNLKLPVKVELASGRNIGGPTDMGASYNYYHLFYRLKTRPNVGDSYVFAINYSDGTSEKVKVSVTAVLDSFAQDLTASGTDRGKPTFSWSAPASPPADYTYLIQVGQANVGREWTYPQDAKGMPSSQTSVVYNVDGNASLTSLQSGTEYDWLIDVIDSDGNQAVYSAKYTP